MCISFVKLCIKEGLHWHVLLVRPEAVSCGHPPSYRDEDTLVALWGQKKAPHPPVGGLGGFFNLFSSFQIHLPQPKQQPHKYKINMQSFEKI